METGGKKPGAGKRKVRWGGRVADLICNSHVAWDYMRGLTRSARGTDGPTQQNLCTHVRGCRLHVSLSIILYIPVPHLKSIADPLISLKLLNL